MTETKLKPPIRRELPAVRRAEVIEAALRLAARVGAQGLVRDKIAEEAGISSSLLHRYFGSMDLMREIIIKTAFEREDTNVLYKSLSIEDFKKLNNNSKLAKQLCEFVSM
jgi:AcrR family transcriptional regulator